jgi:uncharacterized RDD family membrane protein YckC
MSSSVRYETPENVQVEYRAAGLGTRFLAYWIDGLILTFLILATAVVLVILAAAAVEVDGKPLQKLAAMIGEPNPDDPQSIVHYFVGVAILVMSLSSFVYFSMSEFFLRGQTYGKRLCKIRVVKTDGFALDVGSILLRNVFRVLDQIPLMWIVPVVAQASQRFGDMVAGTIVVCEETAPLSPLRQALAERSAVEARFRFDQTRLAKLAPNDFEAVERMLERWDALPVKQRLPIVDRLLPALCTKLGVDEPPRDEQRLFLEDLLAAEFRRQDRQLR